MQGCRILRERCTTGLNGRYRQSCAKASRQDSLRPTALNQNVRLRSLKHTSDRHCGLLQMRVNTKRNLHPAKHHTEPTSREFRETPKLYTAGKMSRTSSFRNACCLQERESTTNRAKSQTSCSSERHFNTRDARSDEIVKRLRCFKGLSSTLLGDDRNAS